MCTALSAHPHHFKEHQNAAQSDKVHIDSDVSDSCSTNECNLAGFETLQVVLSIMLMAGDSNTKQARGGVNAGRANASVSAW